MKGIVVSSDSNRATQYKALKDAIPIFCAEKGYCAVGEIVQDMEDWDMSTYYLLLRMIPFEGHFLRLIRL